MSNYKDWPFSIEFNVPAGDTEGAFTEALFDAAVEHMPSGAAGVTARADTSAGKVWISFTLVDASKDLAQEITAEMPRRIVESVASVACIDTPELL